LPPGAQRGNFQGLPEPVPERVRLSGRCAMGGPSGGWLHDRRRFLQLLGMAGLTSAVNSSMGAWPGARVALAAPSPRPGAKASAAPVAAPADSARAGAESTEVSEDARALASVIERRYGQHLNAQQLGAITQEIDWRLKSGQRLRDVRLRNQDEPDFVFQAS
jgi:hypothetical protein